MSGSQVEKCSLIVRLGPCGRPILKLSPVQLLLPQQFCHSLRASPQVGSVGAERQAEEVGGSFLRSGGVEERTVQGAVEPLIARMSVQFFRPLPDQLTECLAGGLVFSSFGDEARGQQRVTGEPVRPGIVAERMPNCRCKLGVR